MFGNEDNSSIAINVDKGGKGMSEGTVSIGISEYKALLELAYKAEMLKEAVLNCAKLDIYGKDLYFSSGIEVAAVFKYAFPTDYESKIRELMDGQTADCNKEGAGDER